MNGIIFVCSDSSAGLIEFTMQMLPSFPAANQGNVISPPVPRSHTPPPKNNNIRQKWE